MHFCDCALGHVIICQFASDYFDVLHRPEHNDVETVSSAQRRISKCVLFLWILELFNLACFLRPGMLAALKGILRLRPGSLAWFGVPCSLLIWVSLGTSKRGTSFDLFGDVSLESVRRSNVHLSRAAILVLVCIAREVWYAIEQPGSSRLPRLPFFDGLLKDDLIPTIFQRLSWPHLSVSLELMVLFM